MGVLLYAVFIGSVNLKCLFLKHAIFPIFMHEKSRCDDIAAAFVCSFCVPALPHDVKCT